MKVRNLPIYALWNRGNKYGYSIERGYFMLQNFVWTMVSLSETAPDFMIPWSKNLARQHALYHVTCYAPTFKEGDLIGNWQHTVYWSIGNRDSILSSILSLNLLCWRWVSKGQSCNIPSAQCFKEVMRFGIWSPRVKKLIILCIK